MQRVKIFSHGSMYQLEEAINNWLEGGMVEIKNISYSADNQNRDYSALVHYVTTSKALFKEWKEGK